jgi:dTDP-4-dehydrorhamnose reductase
VSDKVLIFGSSGQLGADLVSVLQDAEEFEVIPLTHQDADCTDAAAVRSVVLQSRPQIIINSAAYVRVDDCEDHAMEAFAVNAIGALNISRACAEVDALCVYISTDYVFDGDKELPYVESDMPNPINVYGTSKLAGELLVRQSTARWLIIRVASLFGNTGSRGKGGNFIETVLAKAKKGEPLRVIDDVQISPTYTRDAATKIKSVLLDGFHGVVHSANRESCSWYEFAKASLLMCNINADLSPVASTAYLMRARRPKNSILGTNHRLHEMPLWRDALMRYLIDKGHIRPGVRPALGL